MDPPIGLPLARLGGAVALPVIAVAQSLDNRLLFTRSGRPVTFQAAFRGRKKEARHGEGAGKSLEVTKGGDKW